MPETSRTRRVVRNAAAGAGALALGAVAHSVVCIDIVAVCAQHNVPDAQCIELIENCDTGFPPDTPPATTAECASFVPWLNDPYVIWLQEKGYDPIKALRHAEAHCEP